MTTTTITTTTSAASLYQTTLRKTLGVALLFVVGTTTTAIAVTSKTNATTVAGEEATFWDADIFHLPPKVPFPGADWLARLATPDTAYTASTTNTNNNNNNNNNKNNINGKQYTSVYAAFLDNRPLDYPVRNFNAYVNSIFVPHGVARYVTTVVCRDNLDVAHYVLCYVRNLLGGILVYYGVAAIFHYFIYVYNGKATFEDQNRARPTGATIWDQIKLAQTSMIIYVTLPVIDEYMVEQGWTKVYHTVQEIGGWPCYVASMVFYFALVEIGIYWMHRTLHTNKWLYKHVHMLHHKYNKAETLTPWASIAFHPIDGMMQACPYVLVLPIAPCHYVTHFLLLFFTAVWATYIHDAMDWNIEPIMGSKYHTVHHTHYIYNYGQVFTFCDRIWGTYRRPDGPTGVPVTSKQRLRPTTSGRVSGGSKKEY